MSLVPQIFRRKYRVRKFNGGKHYPKVAILTYAQVKAGDYKKAIPYEYAVEIDAERRTPQAALMP